MKFYIITDQRFEGDEVLVELKDPHRSWREVFTDKQDAEWALANCGFRMEEGRTLRLHEFDTNF